MEQRTDLSLFTEKIQALKSQISQIVVGQDDAVELVLTAILANGHVLIEGVPGVAKTLLARLVARLIDARFSRIQFTPDLMPSDVLGTTVFNAKTADFDFHQGPVFADVVLVDEINRAPAKTQAALFEVMEERQATIDGKSYPMGPLFTILATQNPVEQEGTYRLPEAQLDRFLMKIVMSYPSADEEVEVLLRHHHRQAFTKPRRPPASFSPMPTPTASRGGGRWRATRGATGSSAGAGVGSPTGARRSTSRAIPSGAARTRPGAKTRMSPACFRARSSKA